MRMRERVDERGGRGWMRGEVRRVDERVGGGWMRGEGMTVQYKITSLL